MLLMYVILTVVLLPVMHNAFMFLCYVISTVACMFYVNARASVCVCVCVCV